MKTLLVIGYGNMAQALVPHFAAAEFDITIVSPNNARHSGCKYYTSLTEVVGNYDYVLFAIKPQQLQDVLRNLKCQCHTVISILASTPVSAFTQLTPRVIRLMPNIGVRVHQGVTAMYCTPNTNAGDIFPLLQQTGSVVRVQSEQEIDGITIISGSGIGFALRIISLFMRASQDVYPENTIETTLQTFKGAVEIIKEHQAQNYQGVEALVKSVASKGGVTEAGLQAFPEENIFTSIFGAAQKRIVEMQEIDK